MSGRRIDWLAITLYAVLGVLATGFIGWVLWRLAIAVDWMAAALLGFVIIFGMLMVSFDLRGGRDEPATETPTSESGEVAGAAPAAKPRRGRPRKTKPADAPPPAGAAPGRGPRNRAGRAPITEPPGKSRPRKRS